VGYVSVLFFASVDADSWAAFLVLKPFLVTRSFLELVELVVAHFVEQSLLLSSCMLALARALKKHVVSEIKMKYPSSCGLSLLVAVLNVMS
jgi:hypothetical protein